MRVVHIVDRVTAVGGVQTYLETILPALRMRGVESVVLAGGPTAAFAGAAVVSVPGLEADGAQLGAETRQGLREALAAARPDVVYLQIASSPELACEASAVARLVVYAHDYALVCPGNARYLHRSRRFCFEGPGARCFWRAYSERTTNRRPDRILAAYRRVEAWRDQLPRLDSILVASQFMAGILTAGGAPSARVHVVPYPVEQPPPTQPAGTTGAADVLFVGRLVASKGLDVLLHALCELPGATAAIAGDGPERPALEALANRLGLAGRVRFKGWLSPDERAAWFTRSRVLALPSLWQEPFGLAGLEALAAGLPVVASDVGGIPSWLEEGEGGLLVPPGEPARLAEALGRLLEDETLRAQLGARGPEVAARFSLDRHLDLLLSELRV